MKLVKLLLMFLFVGVLRSQTHQTEIIPYRLVPSQAEGYGCWLEIEFIGLPQSMLNDDEMMEMIEEADRNGDGKIDFEEFYRVMKKRGDNPLDDIDSDDD